MLAAATLPDAALTGTGHVAGSAHRARPVAGSAMDWLASFGDDFNAAGANRQPERQSDRMGPSCQDGPPFEGAALTARAASREGHISMLMTAQGLPKVD